MNDKINQKKAHEVHQCSKCGACLTSCPVYMNTMEEGNSPRAKVQLSKHYTANNLKSSKYLNVLVNRCLMCGNCTTNCPSGVEHASLFMRMRSYMACDHGEGWHMKMLYHFLTHEQQLTFASRFAKLGRNKMFEHIAREFRIGNIRVKNIPKFNKRPFREQVKEKILPKGESRGRVLYFTGCATNHVFDGVGHALCRILGMMGYEVEIPKDQVCCGLPLFAHGKMEKAVDNIKTNIKLFNRHDIVAIVTDCATCGSALHEQYGIVLKELGLETKEAEEVSGKVRDIGDFIMEHYALLEPHLNPDAEVKKVTYHMPCHLRNGQGVKTSIEELLQRLPFVQYTRAKDFDKCCGGGGTFFYDYPEISNKMVSKKIEGARDTGADLWVTGCPGCSINLSGNLSDKDTISVGHILELIEKALKRR